MNTQRTSSVIACALFTMASSSFAADVSVELKTSREILSCKASSEQVKNLIDQCLTGEKDTKNYVLTLTIATDKGTNVFTQCNEKKVNTFATDTETFIDNSDIVRQLTGHPDFKHKSISYTPQLKLQQDLVAKKVTIDCKSSTTSYGFIVNVLKTLGLQLDKKKI